MEIVKGREVGGTEGGQKAGNYFHQKKEEDEKEKEKKIP